MSKVIPLDQSENLDLEAIAYELSVLIPRYLNTLDTLEASDDVLELICCLKNATCYRSRLKTIFNHAEKLSKEFSFEVSMLPSLKVELEILEMIYSQVDDQNKQQVWEENLLLILKELVLSQMIDVLKMLGIESDNPDLEALRGAKKLVLQQKVEMS